MRLTHETIEDLQNTDKVWSLLSRWVTPDTADQLRPAVYQFRSRIASNWRRGRVMLAGDAIHVMPPFMGQAYARRSVVHGTCLGVSIYCCAVWLRAKGPAEHFRMESFRAHLTIMSAAANGLLVPIGICFPAPSIHPATALLKPRCSLASERAVRRGSSLREPVQSSPGRDWVRRKGYESAATG